MRIFLYGELYGLLRASLKTKVRQMCPLQQKQSSRPNSLYPFSSLSAAKGMVIFMKKKIVVAALALALFTGGVFAAGVTQEITAQLRPDLSVVIDGAKQTFKDADGNAVYPIVYNGTTYLPLRAIGGVMGKDVEWNRTTQTATLSNPKKTNASGSTTGQKNAIATAKSYLEIIPFSRTGLIKQLEFEKFSGEDATYGVDNCGADWNKQAVKKAEAYLAIMPYSRDALIKQLEFEGFTSEQAVYGAGQNGY